MKNYTKKLLLLLAVIFALGGMTEAKSQSVKINVPLMLLGSPNIGAEFTLTSRFTVSADVLWTPYLLDSGEQVFRTAQGTLEFRYYIKPKYYYSNKMYDGLYLGMYGQFGDFNVGLDKHEDYSKNTRYQGWGLASGVTVGYKMFLTDHLRVDFNLGLGFAHLQYDRYPLGGEYKDYPTHRKLTDVWVGPTKFGISLVYNIFR